MAHPALYPDSGIFLCSKSVKSGKKSRYSADVHVNIVFIYFFFYVRQGLCQQFEYFRSLIYIILLNDVCTDNTM